MSLTPTPDGVHASTHRALYETALRHLTVEQRVARASGAEEPELGALCFDPLPVVIHRLLENPRFGLVHARLIAEHHRTSAGLESLAARALFAADAAVRRGLLRNPQAPDGLLRRLYGGRPLLEHYGLASSRDLPEPTRRIARELMRGRFVVADAYERVEVIVRTEGRCLGLLGGMPIDARTTALLCGRTYTSPLLIQNISRWAAAPPALIAHLLKQDVVRRSASLRTALRRHANAPSGDSR